MVSTAITLSDSVQYLPGIGPNRAKHLEKLNIFHARDLLYWFPRDYEDRSVFSSIADAPEGEPVCIPAMVVQTPSTNYVRKGLELTRVQVVDDQGRMVVTFFNQSYVRQALVQGQCYVFYGKVEGSGLHRQMSNPVFEPEDANRLTGCIVPIYPLTAGISGNLISNCVRRILADCLEELREPLPDWLRQTHQLAQLDYALRTIHFPPSFEELEVARRRLVFEELFFLSAGLAMLKKRRAVGIGYRCTMYPLEEYYATLPFLLTTAQRRTIEEAAADLCSGIPMNRLVQGDVGSGKTVVAAGSVWLAVKNGLQCAMMAPTELLAQQHYRTLCPLLEQSGVRVGLLTGSMRAKQKREVYELLELGMLDFVVGTHALLSEGVKFRKLGLVVTDEQHRFGVNQRAALAAKAHEGGVEAPHTLVMSATPIPRTLALMIYGDLDVSVIDELPPNRQSIDTFLIGGDKRERMYSFIRRQVQEGHQVYAVCPAVEENPEAGGQLSTADLKAVTTYAEELQQVFPNLSVGLVHGRLKGKAKDAVMSAFADGTLDILVSTTVIEVGVDVPNATLMVIENAERFGLSQLHQLRGRVGRGSAKSYCVLLSDNRSPDTRQRLKALCATNDGFKISEEDLKLRGPGDFFGARQHGLPQLKVADLAGDTRVLQEARQAAEAVLQDDPDLKKPEHQFMIEKVKALFDENPDMFN